MNEQGAARPAELVEMLEAVLGLDAAQEQERIGQLRQRLDPSIMLPLMKLHVLDLLPPELEAFVEARLEVNAEDRRLFFEVSLAYQNGKREVEWAQFAELLSEEALRRLMAPMLMAYVLTKRQTVRPRGPARRTGGNVLAEIPILNAAAEELGRADVVLPRPECDAQGECTVNIRLPALPSPWQEAMDEGTVALRMSLAGGWLDVPLHVAKVSALEPSGTHATGCICLGDDKRGYELNLQNCHVVLLV